MPFPQLAPPKPQFIGIRTDTRVVEVFYVRPLTDRHQRDLIKKITRLVAHCRVEYGQIRGNFGLTITHSSNSLISMWRTLVDALKPEISQNVSLRLQRTNCVCAVDHREDIGEFTFCFANTISDEAFRRHVARELGMALINRNSAARIGVIQVSGPNAVFLSLECFRRDFVDTERIMRQILMTQNCYLDRLDVAPNKAPRTCRAALRWR